MTISAHRTQLIWSPLAGWVLLSLVSVPAAHGQNAPSGTATIQNAPAGTSVQAKADPVTSLPEAAGVQEKPELGITVGAFTLFPSLDVNIGYDNNVFAQPTSAGTTSSAYTAISPSLDLRSEWLNHSLHFVAAGSFGFYNNASSQNYQNYILQADGKLEIQTDFYVTGLVGYRRATEALGTPNVVFAQAPTVVDSVPIELGVYQRFNRFFYQITGRASRYWYTDNSTINPGGLPAASRDRTEFEESLRLGYEIYDDLAVFISPTINQRRYISNVNAADQQRDSNGLNLGVGAQWAINATSTIEATAGYQTQSYATSFASTSTFTFGLTGSWSGYAPLTIRPYLTRSINETALSNYKNYVSTNIGIDFSYIIHGPWSATGGVTYSTADYSPADGVAGVNPRTDTYIRGQIGFLYSLRPQLSIGPVFEYIRGSSTDPTSPPYDRETISVRLTAKR